MIFKENAPKYWAKGLPVIPLFGKAPVLAGWQRYNDTMPSAIEMDAMLRNHPDCNMGLPLGKQSRCVALDVDSEVATEIALIDELVPTSPWVRVGKKGKVMMFRFNGEKTFRIKDESGRTICELLSSKTQVVLPPSIHPDTKAPYIANAELVDMVDTLPVLPENIEEILRNAFVDRLGLRLNHVGWTKTIDFVSRGSRDVKMTSVAGLYANAVLRGEMTLKEAIEIFRAWCSTQTEQIAGDPIDVEKGVSNLVKFLMRNVVGEKKRPLPTGWDNGLTADEKKQLGLVIDEEVNVSWDFNKLRDYLKGAFEEANGDAIEVDRIIDYALDKVARSQSMNSLEVDRALHHIAHLTKDANVPALRRRLLEMQRDGIMGSNHTEIARAVLRDLNELIPDSEEFSTQREFNSLRYYNDEFWQWAGSHWEVMNKSEILRLISREYGNLPAAARASDHKGILTVMKSHLGDCLVEDNTAGVNYANGFVDAYGVLHEHSKKYGCTYTLPYCYRPELASLEAAPKFARFLKSVWGRDEDYEEKVRALRQVIGATIFGLGPSFARAILLFGIGQSGKTQLLTIISKLLPPEALSYVTPYDFDDKFKPVKLSTSLLNICGELDEKRDIPSASFKQVVDGSVMQGQFKGRDVFSFVPKATHWFASNHLPKSKDTTEGFNRRWAVFTFNRMVPKEEKVRGIGDIIVAEEREAISAWAIGAMAELHRKSDYDLPKSHYKSVEDMCSENDSLFFFLTADEGPRKVDAGEVEMERLYEAYRAFCYSVAGAKPIGLRKFYTRMREMGIIMGFTVKQLVAVGLSLDRTVGVKLGRG